MQARRRVCRLCTASLAGRGATWLVGPLVVFKTQNRMLFHAPVGHSPSSVGLSRLEHHRACVFRALCSIPSLSTTPSLILPPHSTPTPHPPPLPPSLSFWPSPTAVMTSRWTLCSPASLPWASPRLCHRSESRRHPQRSCESMPWTGCPVFSGSALSAVTAL